LVLSGLTESAYTIVLFGSRDSDAWGYPKHRKGQFTVNGVTKIQDHAGNTTEKTYFRNVAPVNGTIVVNVIGFPEARDDDPNLELGYAYINVMEVIVEANANTAPTANAGADILLGWPSTVAALDATVTDDGLPSYGTLTTTWTQVSGPGVATFTDASAVDTDATFTARGVYVLRLTASDGALSASDEMEVIAGAEADFDGDGVITSNDVDLLYAVLDTTVPPTDPMYDLTADSQVTIADAEYLVEVVVGTSMADTNLDMEVDILDLGNLANVYGGAGTFSDGDTDGDGVVGILDLGNLADDYGKTF